MAWLALPFLLFCALTIGLRRWSRIRWYARAGIWCLLLPVWLLASANIVSQSRAVGRRASYLNRCKFNLRDISRLIGEYRADHGSYPATFGNLGIDARELHCPRAVDAESWKEAQADDSSLGSDPPEYAPENPTLYGGRNFADLVAVLPIDYLYHRPPKNAPGTFVVVEEKTYNHPLGGDATLRYRNVLLLDGTIETRIKPN